VLGTRCWVLGSRCPVLGLDSGSCKRGVWRWGVVFSGRENKEMKSPTSIRSHRDLVVWQEAMELAELCYKRTSGFPSHERYGLMSQIRRAVVSIASNFAEGHGRRTLPSYLNHLSIGLGSQAELETQIELSHRLAYLNDAEASEVLELAGRVGRRLHALMRSLNARNGMVSLPRAQHLVPGFRHPEPHTSRIDPSTQYPAPNTHREVTA